MRNALAAFGDRGGAHHHPLPDGGDEAPDFVAGEVDTKFLERWMAERRGLA
jgi:hypothetical protein